MDGTTKLDAKQNYILEVFLVDHRPGAHQEIVSNIYILNLPLQIGNTSKISILNRVF